jgi:hypothetical protein
MIFTIPQEDLRRTSGTRPITDENGNDVGIVYFGSHPLGRAVTILGKYRQNFTTHAECQAFADGVAAVLTHMTKDETTK